MQCCPAVQLLLSSTDQRRFTRRSALVATTVVEANKDLAIFLRIWQMKMMFSCSALFNCPAGCPFQRRAGVWRLQQRDEGVGRCLVDRRGHVRQQAQQLPGAVILPRRVVCQDPTGVRCEGTSSSSHHLHPPSKHNASLQLCSSAYHDLRLSTCIPSGRGHECCVQTLHGCLLTAMSTWCRRWLRRCTRRQGRWSCMRQQSMWTPMPTRSPWACPGSQSRASARTSAFEQGALSCNQPHNSRRQCPAGCQPLAWSLPGCSILEHSTHGKWTNRAAS